MSEQYEVYGRTREDEALTHLGSLSVPEGTDLQTAVRKAHGEDWLELVAIPGESIGWAIEQKG